MTTEILKDYIIYKLYCKNKEIIDEYYGHTCAFRARKCDHKKNCNNENSIGYNTEKYKIIRSNGGWDNWIMSPIEELKNCSLVNARIRKQFHIDFNKSIMNKFKAYITEDQIKERDKKNHNKKYLKNRDKILEKSKENYLENRDKILEKSKENYLVHRDKIIEKHKKEKITCICGKIIRKDGKAEHERTKFHCQFIQSAI